jgi:hypothetical protein
MDLAHPDHSNGASGNGLSRSAGAFYDDHYRRNPRIEALRFAATRFQTVPSLIVSRPDINSEATGMPNPSF